MVYRASLLALILGLTIVRYAAIWDAGFVYEDNNGFPGNTLHEPWAGWRGELAKHDLQPRSFVRSVTAISYRLNAWLAPSARGYHLVNLGIHLANVMLLTVLIWPLLEYWALFAAGIFALHPLQVEAVAGIAYRGELLAGGFLLLALLAAWRVSSRWGLWIAIGCGLLAFGAKETTAAGMVLLWPFVAPTGRRGLPCAIWGAVLLGAGGLFWNSPGMVSGTAYARSVVLNGAGVVLLAVRAAIPHTQTVDLDLAHGQAVLLIVPLGLLVLAGGLLAGVVDGRGWARWMRAAAGGVLAGLIVRVVSPSPELLHEHAMYAIPMASWAVAISAAWAKIPLRRTPLTFQARQSHGAA